MPGKKKIAMSWAAACGGCDVSLLDTGDKILELAAVADIVYWPVAMDFKRAGLLERRRNSIDFGLFNGAVRTSEQADDARLFREKCRTLVAYGSCACFGGVPGLANLATREEILDEVYRGTPSTDNPEDVRPQTRHAEGRMELTLPAFSETVRSLDQVVEVDLFLPGCPPTHDRILDLVGVVERVAAGGRRPPRGTVLALDKALCDSCPRSVTRKAERMSRIARPHEIVADADSCFLDQGLVCMGLATRGGCEATCIRAHMPCRGCFGPVPGQLDPGAEAISAIGSLAGAANENDVPAHEMKKAVRSIRDPAGTFYRFTLPHGFVHRAVRDKPGKDEP